MAFLLSNKEADGLEEVELGQESRLETPHGFSILVGKETFYHEFEDFSVLFQGEIDNRAGIGREEDHAVFVQAVREEKVDELDGRFLGIVIDDGFELYRDFSGFIPIFFHSSGKEIAVSTRIEPILQLKPELREINREVAAQYLEYGVADHRRETFFKGVERLKPGENLLYSQNFEIEETSPVMDAPEDFRGYIEDRIEKLKPEEEYACGLSGGVDSTIVGAFCDDFRTNFFHLSPEKGSFDPGFFDAVKDSIDHEIEEVVIGPEDLVEEIERNLKIQEQPTTFIATQAQSLLYSSIEEEIDSPTVLQGSGADEFFLGYRKFNRYYLFQQLQENIFSGLLEIFRFRGALNIDEVKAVLKKRLVGGDLGVYETRGPAVVKEKVELPGQPDSLESVKENHFHHFWFPHILRTTYRNAYSKNMAVKPVFLSAAIKAYTDEIPPDDNFQTGLNKYQLRKTFEDVLPDQIFNRKRKTGVIDTDDRLYTSKVKREFLEVFRSESFQKREIVDGEKVLRLFRTGRIGFWKAYRIYCFEKWTRAYFDGKRH